MMELDPALKKGLDLPKPSYDQAVLPPDITVLSSEQLAEMFTILTGWADYIASQLVQAQLAERDSLRKAEFAENKALVLNTPPPKGLTMTIIKAKIDIDPDIMALRDKYEACYAYRKMMEMMLTNQERDITLVSREITRRTADQRAFRKDYGTL
jgi:hypothetical protein